MQKKKRKKEREMFRCFYTSGNSDEAKTIYKNDTERNTKGRVKSGTKKLACLLVVARMP